MVTLSKTWSGFWGPRNSFVMNFGHRKIGFNLESVVTIFLQAWLSFFLHILWKFIFNEVLTSCLHSVLTVISELGQIMGLTKKEKYAVCFFLTASLLFWPNCKVMLWLKHFSSTSAVCKCNCISFLCFGFQTSSGIIFPFILSSQCNCSLSSLWIVEQQLYCLYGDNYLVVVMWLLGSQGRFDHFYLKPFNMIRLNGI